MKKLLVALTAVMFVFGAASAQASVLSETNKALNKANQTMNTVNQVNSNVEYAKKQNTETARANAKQAAKNAAKNEAKRQTNSFWDRLFNR